MNLNRQQTEAVLHLDGPCMVLSGPGSGKTTVITNRVLCLVKQYRIPQDEILVITFTRAAAEEMKRRYLKLSGESATAVTFGTFHAVFFHILSVRYRLTADAIASDAERYRAAEEAVRETDPKLIPDRSFLSGLLSDFSHVKNHDVSPESFGAKSPHVNMKKLYEAYQKELSRRNKMDYDDILLKTRELFTTEPETLSFWRESFRYFLVDEFQDINPVQYDILRMMASPRNNLFIVGDDDQSVYGFRGASPELMLRFPEQYKNAKRIHLSVNYRSFSEIVAPSAKLIAMNKQRFQKTITSSKGSGGTLSYRVFRNDEQECTRIADRIEELIKKGVPKEQIAVLSRTHAGNTLILRKFISRSIPFLIRDKIQNLYAHPVCRPLFACLNFASGNTTRKNLLQFMNTPYRSIRREDLTEETVDLNEIAARYRDDPARRYVADRILFFARQLELLQRLTNPYAMIHYFRTGMGYDAFLKEKAEQKGEDASESLRVLDEVQQSASEYATVETWYRFIASYTRQLKEDAKKTRADGKGRVAVCTLHGSKGLEFHHVFIPDLVERNVPHEKMDKENGLEEERRLFYVGMTRASEALYLSSVKNHLGHESLPSRFIEELRLSEPFDDRPFP